MVAYGARGNATLITYAACRGNVSHPADELSGPNDQQGLAATNQKQMPKQEPVTKQNQKQSQKPATNQKQMQEQAESQRPDKVQAVVTRPDVEQMGYPVAKAEEL